MSSFLPWPINAFFVIISQQWFSAVGCSWCNLLTRAEPLIFYYCEKMILVLEAVLIIYLDTQQGNMRRWLMEYKVVGLIPILTFNYRSGTCVNVSSPSTLIQLEIPNGTHYLRWASETARGKEGDSNLTHKFTCLNLSCMSSDLNAPLLVRLGGKDIRAFALVLSPSFPFFVQCHGIAVAKSQQFLFSQPYNINISWLINGQIHSNTLLQLEHKVHSWKHQGWLKVVTNHY